MTRDLLLSVRNISKAYDGVQALTEASLDLRAGEVQALVGENGAGKSTLIKIITGAVQPDAGEITLCGQTVVDNSPLLAKSLGIVAIYQQPVLFPELTVSENIALGLEQKKAWHKINWSRRNARASGLLQRVGATIDPNKYAGDLTMPEQQLVEIARAVGAKAKVLVMDEPTAALSEEEIQNLFRVIAELRRQGVGMIYISHRLEELPAIADRVTVLRDGRVIETREMADVTRQELIRMMVGREVSTVFPKRAVGIGDVVVEMRGFGCSSTGVKNVNLSVRAGEIVGLAGLMGAGRTELARTIFGLTPADEGELLVNGSPVTFNNPAAAIGHGIAYVPEDRRRHGVIPDMAISTNITLASLDRIARLGNLDFAREKEMAVDCTRKFAVKTLSIFAPVSTLSGGNQQKVALGRWLNTKPSVLILDEPTQGIDIGAKSEIHALMIELAAQGMAIIMISSEMQEIMGMSDRIAVMRDGTIVGVTDCPTTTQQEILSLALGHEYQAASPQTGPAAWV